MKKVISLILVSTLIVSCQKKSSLNKTDKLIHQLKNYDSLATAEVMVLGTFHFNQEALKPENQTSIQELIDVMKSYHPTKVFVEWEPQYSQITNERYRLYKKDSFDISDRYNEVYQLGFRLAKSMNHDSLYLFDDQTEFTGSLKEFNTKEDGFSFELFTKYAMENDNGFYNKHEEILINTFKQNQDKIEAQDFKTRIDILNSPENQKINAQRMHMYEVRIGIQKNWSGPDWLGRWYRRNVRMMSNVLQQTEPGDRHLLIVGDNHKWVLDMLFENTPDFRLKQMDTYLKQR